MKISLARWCWFLGLTIMRLMATFSPPLVLVAQYTSPNAPCPIRLLYLKCLDGSPDWTSLLSEGTWWSWGSREFSVTGLFDMRAVSNCITALSSSMFPATSAMVMPAALSSSFHSLGTPVNDPSSSCETCTWCFTERGAEHSAEDFPAISSACIHPSRSTSSLACIIRWPLSSLGTCNSKQYGFPSEVDIRVVQLRRYKSPIGVSDSLSRK
mmetsp:Transcript_9407/g.26396  ORF Transcript_9407/g.26396 Transcript_9407/m.26396 type:complete len:211 (-) Transcript_9407:230-862(-)